MTAGDTGRRVFTTALTTSLFVVGACASAPVGSADVSPDDRRAILAVVGDTILSLSPAGEMFVGDSVTAEALAPAALRRGWTIVSSADRVWCEGRPDAGRRRGVRMVLRLESVSGNRASASWGVTCVMTTYDDTAAFGDMGTYELTRVAGRWRIVRELIRFAL